MAQQIKDQETQELWKWEKTSKVHREKFEKLLEFARDNPREIKEVNGVRFCPDPDFCIGSGADGTCVYVGLSKDGYERAVKCLNKITCANIGDNERKILNTLNTVNSKFTVRYWSYDDQSDDEFAYLVLDLCEETLEEYVKGKSQDDLTASAPSIMRQILEGLNDLHREPEPVLHRDVKPSNIMRDTNGKWLLIDFGLSRTLSTGQTSHRSDQKGTTSWRAVESYPPEDDPNNEEVRYKRQSDIQVAGMVGFYILTKGKHPFGSDEYEVVINLRDGKPVNLPRLRDPVARDLISWMLQHKPEDRPYADQALKHPYLQSIEQQAELLKAVGNQSEIKGRRTISSKVADEINNHPFLSSTSWQIQIPRNVLTYLCYDSERCRTFRYGYEWTECLRLIRNATAFWNHRPHPAPAEHYVVEEPGKYFLKLFPCLPVVVHKVIREDPVWKERYELRGFLEAVGNQSDIKGSEEKESPELWKWEKKSEVHRGKFEKLKEFAKDKPKNIKEVNGVRFRPHPDFCIGYGADGTCVYVGLSKDGYERAVKCLNKITCANTGDNEREILNTLNAVDSKYVVRYWSYDDQSDDVFAYLVLDLCEETLQEHVKAKSQDDLTNSAQSILRQILEGLDDLHREPEPVLHRDVKPSNIMRDTNGKWLLADFGLSRTLSTGQTSHKSDQKGTKSWRAVESYPPKDDPNNEEVRYKRQSDIQVAGMVGFYILTKGKHPFGSDEYEVVINLRDGKPVNLPRLRDPVARDLISWMLQHKPEDRPYADQALKHPYLQSIEQQAELLKAVGNQSEIKGSRTISSKVADEINNNPLLSSTVWQGQIPPDVLAYLCYDSEKRRTFTYGPEWTECLRLIRNAAAHWNQRPHPAPTEHYVVEEPGKYFVKLFPCLPVVVHKVIREEESSVWKEREELKAFFQTLMKLDN